MVRRLQEQQLAEGMQRTGSIDLRLDAKARKKAEALEAQIEAKKRRRRERELSQQRRL